MRASHRLSATEDKLRACQKLKSEVHFLVSTVVFRSYLMFPFSHIPRRFFFPFLFSYTSKSLFSTFPTSFLRTFLPCCYLSFITSSIFLPPYLPSYFYISYLFICIQYSGQQQWGRLACFSLQYIT